MRIKGAITSAITAIIMTVTAACAPDPNAASEYRFIDPDGWAYGDTLTYTPAITDSVSRGTIAVSLNHTASYPYANLWLEMTVTDSVAASRDTVEISFADPLGRWLGRGIGTDFQLSDTLPRSITLRQGSVITLRHIMRADTIADIDRIGISFTPEK